MAKEKWIVGFNVRGVGVYDNAAEVTKSTTGKSLPQQEPLGAGNGFRGQVFGAYVCEVEAESVEEAILVAQKAYGSPGGGGTGALKKSFDTGVSFAAKVTGGGLEWKSL